MNTNMIAYRCKCSKMYTVEAWINLICRDKPCSGCSKSIIDPQRVQPIKVGATNTDVITLYDVFEARYGKTI